MPWLTPFTAFAAAIVTRPLVDPADMAAPAALVTTPLLLTVTFPLPLAAASIPTAPDTFPFVWMLILPVVSRAVIAVPDPLFTKAFVLVRISIPPPVFDTLIPLVDSAEMVPPIAWALMSATTVP
ncbi:hypothetical protein [Phyllobacterium sp. 22229]|uniref:hypothetical protein n=1 Tax=Phyllobacterium sp. 22229 TaxID=3453895 RepID=UPI003F873481